MHVIKRGRHTLYVMHYINREKGKIILEIKIVTLELLLLLLLFADEDDVVLDSMLGSIKVVSVNKVGIDAIIFLSVGMSLWIDAVDELGELSGKKNGSGGRSGESDLQSSVVWDEEELLGDLLLILDLLVILSWRHHDLIWVFLFRKKLFESFINNWGILFFALWVSSFNMCWLRS